MRTLFLLLLTCLPCFAQFGAEQPMFQLTSATTPFNPSAVSTIRYWWVSSDLTNGATASNWVDRIVGMQLTNTSGNSPTNASSGVYFGGATWLEYSSYFPAVTSVSGDASTTTVFVVFAPITPATDFAGVIQMGASDGLRNGGTGLFTTTAGNLHQGGSAGNGTVAKYASGVTLDFLTTFTDYNPGFHNRIYTNNLVSANTGFGAWANGNTVGWYKSLNRFFKGYILEMAWYTNSLPTATISNLHYYATNKYSFSP